MPPSTEEGSEGATSSDASAATLSAEQAALAAEYLALLLADDATQILIETTEALIAEEMTAAQAAAYEMAMQMILESAEEALGVELSDETLALAMELAQEALPLVLDTLEALASGAMTPEQALQELQQAAGQFEEAAQLAEELLSQTNTQDLALDPDQLAEIRARAQAQLERALAVADKAQGGGALERAGSLRRPGH